MTPTTKNEHWFTFGDACVCVTEKAPAGPVRGTLLFLHGRFSDARVWEEAADRLSRFYRCLALDFPGFGRSFSNTDRLLDITAAATLTLQLLERLVPAGQNLAIAGHDLGGVTAQLAAIRSGGEGPQRVQSLVLLNSPCISSSVSDVSRWSLRREAGDLWRHHKRPLIQSRNFYRDNWPGLYERRGWKEGLRKLSQPALILWGARDRINPLEDGLELMKELPEAYFFQHDSAGHWVSKDDPEWVSARMREFLFRTEARGPRLRSAG